MLLVSSVARAGKEDTFPELGFKNLVKFFGLWLSLSDSSDHKRH